MAKKKSKKKVEIDKNTEPVENQVEEVNFEHKRWGAPGYAERVKDFGEMNSLCHQLETLLTHGTRQIPNSCRNMYWDQQVVNQTQHALKINDDWWNLTTQDKYDVYVAKRILGKDYRECYRDNDDATRTEMGPNRKTVPLAFKETQSPVRPFALGDFISPPV